MDSREVELKEQRDENSQLFQDSLMQQSHQQASRFQQVDSYGLPRSHTLYTQQAAHLAHLAPPTRPRVTINLEDCLLEEQKLHELLEALRSGQNGSLSCDDWWDVTEQNHFITAIVHQVVKDPILKHTIMKAQKYETIAVGIVQFYHLLAYE